MTLAKISVNYRGEATHEDDKTLDINRLSTSLIFGVFSVSSKFVCKYVKERKDGCQEKIPPNDH